MPNNNSELRMLNAKEIQHSKTGFTLIELMIVVAIIAILTVIGAVIYGAAVKSSRISKRIGDLRGLSNAIETYKSSTGYYPKVATGVSGTANDQCITSATGLASASVSPGFTPTFMTVLPNDPSGGSNCYKYQSDVNGTSFKVWTSNTEMTSAEYLQQPGLIDPDRDGTADNCIVDTGGNITAWATFATLANTSSDACAF